MKPKTFFLFDQELPFLKGPALERKLSELADVANAKHRESIKAWRGALEYAHEAGRALMEAKKRLGGRGKWGRWRARHFEASAETARVYARIARKWDDPRIVEARNSGIEVTSICGFLKLLRGEPLPPPAPAEPDRLDGMRSMLREQFAAVVKGLREEELEIFNWNFDAFWERWYSGLQDSVCAALEFDPYEEGPGGEERRRENEELKRRARKPVSADE